LFIFGTRPEAIKMAPLIEETKRNKGIKSVVCVTAQHRGMLDQVLKIFGIVPDYDLNVMERGQDLFDVTGKCLRKLRSVLKKVNPDVVVVQGDTTTAFIAGLAAYYLRLPLAHVEAGLRTRNKYSPFPEEINRHLLSIMADYNFAPTEWAKNNLLKDGIPENRIWVTGNTVIDALMKISSGKGFRDNNSVYLKMFKGKLCGLDLEDKKNKIILVTGHRRESFGQGFKNICNALRKISDTRKDVVIIYPVHLNPNVRKPVHAILRGKSNIRLIEPLAYDAFIFLMSRSFFLLSDSGGIQEEAPTLKKPVLLMRDTTERPEGVRAGTVKMVGTDTDRIVREALKLLSDPDALRKMSRKANPYGDGKSAKRIIGILRKGNVACRKA